MSCYHFYVYEMLPPKAHHVTNMSVGAEDRTVTITDLTPGLTYDITLVALSDYLPSPAVAVRVTLGEPSMYVYVHVYI